MNKHASTNLVVALVCAALIVIITLLSATSIGFTSREEIVPTVAKDQVIKVLSEGRQPSMTGPVVYRVTYENTFLPRQHQLPFVSACLYDSNEKRGAYLGTRWQVSNFDSQQWSDGGNVVQLGRETKTIGLEVQPYTLWKPSPVPVTEPIKLVPVPPDEQYDLIFLFVDGSGRMQSFYPQCDNLQAEDMARAKKIQLV